MVLRDERAQRIEVVQFYDLASVRSGDCAVEARRYKTVGLVGSTKSYGQRFGVLHLIEKVTVSVTIAVFNVSTCSSKQKCVLSTYILAFHQASVHLHPYPLKIIIMSII